MEGDGPIPGSSVVCVPTQSKGSHGVLVEDDNVDAVSCGFREGKLNIEVFGINLGYRSISSVFCSALDLSQTMDKMVDSGHDNT